MSHRGLQTLQDEEEAGAHGESTRYQLRRLLIEAAIEEGYPLRLERRLTSGRTSTRIVQPVELDAGGEGGAGRATLVTRSSDYRQSTTVLEESDEVSIVTTRLRIEDERRGPWRVGQAVRDTEFGPGVVQAFRGVEEGDCLLVRFTTGAPKQLPFDRAELRAVA